MRTNDPVLLSWLAAVLRAEGIDSFVFDAHASIAEGSISAIPRRLMVAGEDYERARVLMREATDERGKAGGNADDNG